MKLVSIPKNKYEEYRLDAIFDGYKWDPQFLDNNTVARHALILSKREAGQVEEFTEQLFMETVNAENALLNNLKLAKPLKINHKMRKLLKRMSNYKSENNIRLMRFDFHPCLDGKWAVSEVNSDVPGGFAEGSLLPGIAADLLNNEQPLDKHVYNNIGELADSVGKLPGKDEGKYFVFKNFGEQLINAIIKKVKTGGRLALIHCTAYSDDRQVMQFVGDKLESLGFGIVYAAADHIKFFDKKAICVLDGQKGAIDAILRFTPLEWLVGLPTAWHGYFDTVTTSCNHPIAVFAQTKRFPFVWDSLEMLGVSLEYWRKLLPQTLTVAAAKGKKDFIYKPILGRVGEGISIKDAITKEEYEKIKKDVKKHPKRYIAQKRFDSLPLVTDEGEQFHICLGSYGIDGKWAGFYARISKTARIDSLAADIPVLIADY